MRGIIRRVFHSAVFRIGSVRFSAVNRTAVEIRTAPHCCFDWIRAVHDGCCRDCYQKYFGYRPRHSLSYTKLFTVFFFLLYGAVWYVEVRCGSVKPHRTA